jgi:hypothetical protein
MSAIPYETVASVAVAEKEPETVQEVIEWSNAHPLRWLVENFILEQAVHVLHGLEESFKTMFMLQLHEALAKGGQFLLWETEGGLRTGIAELEMKMQMCGSRFGNFWRNGEVPDIHILPESARREVAAAVGLFKPMLDPNGPNSEENEAA